MKHLKLFENLSDNNSYTLINHDEFSKLLEQPTLLDKKVVDLAFYLTNNDYEEYDENPKFTLSSSNMKILLNIDGWFQGVDIYGVNDEWYALHTTFGYWKCDQFNGLKEFFNNIDSICHENYNRRPPIHPPN